MEAKILKLRRNRKKEIFGFLTFWLGRIFPEKSVLTEKKWKKFLPPTHAVLRSNVGRPLSALERGIAERLGAFLLFSEPQRETQIEISGNFRENFELRRNLSFSFRSGISRSEIENFPTEDHEGVQIGSGGNPDNNERRRELSEFFLIHRMFRSSFVARKQRIFDGIHNHRTMDGGKNPQAKTEPKERNFWFLTFG